MSGRIKGIIGLIIICATMGYVVYMYNQPDYNITHVPSEAKIPDVPWTVLSAIKPNDSLRVILVTYQEKYGSEQSIRCMSVFQSSTQYRLNSSEMSSSIILERSNIVSIKTEKVLK